MIDVEKAQEHYINIAIGKAASDYKYGNVNNGYPEGPEREAYAGRIYELEQIASALSIENGEDV